MKNMLAMQKDLEENAAKEAQLAASMQDNKKKLLTDLAAEEAKREAAVKNLQALKEKEKQALVGSLWNGTEKRKRYRKLFTEKYVLKMRKMISQFFF